MWKRFKRLFIIKTRFEACLIIYALALGAIERGLHYLETYPGTGGYLLMAACTGSVFLGGAKIFDSLRYERESVDMAAISATNSA
ncbi:MAG: hypothetical protein IT553_05465 [Sphingomonadaceae bacterium]|nr:hypothetical protein [Sphingomonadaceae bacterium]